MRNKRKFALQAVLDYRRHVEMSALRIVAECRRRCDVYTQRHAQCRAAIEEYARSIRVGQEVRLENARLCEILSARLRRAIESDTPGVAQARAELDEACRVAAAASRDRRAIEILRERHLAAIAVADLRAEEAEIADLDALRPRLRAWIAAFEAAK